MKKIFIYYSLTGNGDLVAKTLKEKKIDIYKVETSKPMPKSFFMQIFVGGFMALIKYKTKLLNFYVDISEYDEVIIGSPIWNDRISTPINEVLNKLDLSNKKLSFIFYSGSGQGNKAIKRIMNEYPHRQIIILKEPKKNPDFRKKLNC